MGRWIGHVAIFVIPIVNYGLWKLTTMPYRPPVDMSTLLDGGSIARCRTMIVMLSLTWLTIVGLRLRALRRSA